MNRILSFIATLIISVECLNDRPIIGILSQETFSVNKYFPGENYESYIAASYVKFIESAGARVIPVWIGRDKEYYEAIVQSTNGMLFPGGATWFNQSNGYADAGQMIYDITLDINKNGHYYPIFGICLGMELLIHTALNGKEIRDNCSAKKISLPLDFKPDFNNSHLFSPASKAIVDILRKESVTYNYHQFCITEAKFDEFGLNKEWRILSTSVADIEFISSLESQKYPFYGLQFHPEKNVYEFKSSLNIPHGSSAIKVSQYFANLFVDESRKNNHKFPSWTVEQKALIYNYKPAYTGQKNASYEQLYMFTKDDNNRSLNIDI